jgi:hypothetical protein
MKDVLFGTNHGNNMAKSKTCHGIKRVNESKVPFLQEVNKVRRIEIKVHYKWGSQNQGEFVTEHDAIKALTAFCEI